MADASMAIDQVIKYKVGNCLGCGPFQCLSFCILGEVISCNNNILVPLAAGMCITSMYTLVNTVAGGDIVIGRCTFCVLLIWHSWQDFT